MITDLDDPDKDKTEPLSKMTKANNKHYSADVRVMNYILQEGESLESVYERLSTLANVMDRNDVRPIKISKKARILELKQRNMKITVLTSYTSYPSRKIRRICSCTSPKTTREQGSIRRAASGLRPYHFTHLERRLTMEEMLYNFINEGKQEHKEMRAFICEFRTTNEILFKERNNSLSELRFEVQELLKTTNEPVIQTSSEEQTPSIPFPQRLRKEKEEAQQRKFLENLKQLHINLPFIEALSQTPKYAKFLKVLLTNKARLEEACTITMNERCSAVFLNKLPSKEKDLGSFTIACDIGQLHINNALADLGASISLMPYTMYKKLGLGEPKATRMSLELTDRGHQDLMELIEHLYLASANEIDEKRPELKSLPNHLEYAYLQGDK
ncbi:reverse transcriptase domain-containing protein [Tanacetum coccineum]